MQLYFSFFALFTIFFGIYLRTGDSSFIELFFPSLFADGGNEDVKLVHGLDHLPPLFDGLRLKVQLETPSDAQPLIGQFKWKLTIPENSPTGLRTCCPEYGAGTPFYQREIRPGKIVGDLYPDDWVTCFEPMNADFQRGLFIQSSGSTIRLAVDH